MPFTNRLSSLLISRSILGSTEGTKYIRNGVDVDIRFTATVSTGKSGLSFGLTQLDVANNTAAKNLFIEALNDAVSNGRITQEQSADFLNRAATKYLSATPSKNFSADEKSIISAQVLLPYSDRISEVDANHIEIAASIVNRTIRSVSDAWEGNAGVFETSNPDQLLAVGHLLSWSNRTGGLGVIQKYLSGEAVQVGSVTLQIEGPPTIDDIRTYLRNQAQFRNNPNEFNNVEANILRGINGIPAIDEIPWRFGQIPSDSRAFSFAEVELGSNFVKFLTNSCFLAGTPILAEDHKEIPIQNLRAGDIVMAFDNKKDALDISLKQRKIKKIFSNVTSKIIDLRGLLCTPGHVFLSGEIDPETGSNFDHVSKILARDGTLVDSIGRKVRARCGSFKDGDDDIIVKVLYRQKETGIHQTINVRCGIPVEIFTHHKNDCKTELNLISLRGWLIRYGVSVKKDGTFIDKDGKTFYVIDWPEFTTPFDTVEMQNWIVTGPDGQPYTPPWIADLPEEDERSNLRVVGEMPSTSFSAV